MPRAWRLPSETVHVGQRMGKRTAGTALGAMSAVVSFPGSPAVGWALEQTGWVRHALVRWTASEMGNSSAPGRLGVGGPGVAA